MSKKDPAKQEAWIKKLQAFETSGLSAKKWCAQNHEQLHTFKYWKYRLQATEPYSTFEEIKADIEPQTLKLNKQQYTIEVSLDLDKKSVKAILQVLASCSL